MPPTPVTPSIPVASPPPVTTAASLADPQQAVEAINKTGIDLFLRLAQANAGSNLNLSPYSLETALAMLYAGARGQTAAQMAQVLNFLPASDAIHADFAALLQALQAEGSSPGDQLSTANAIWVQQGFPINAEFTQLLQSDYGSAVKPVDFMDYVEQARQTINSWVSQQTQGMILDLIPGGALNPANTRLVLTNAVYFNAEWSEPFDASQTNTQWFEVAPGQSVRASMMHQTSSFGYYAGGNFTALSKNYTGGNQSMVILLPNQTTGLASFEQSLTADNLTTWLSQMQTQQVAVSLPSFQAQQTLNLGNELSSMGMPLAFTGEADFSGIAPQPLNISQVLQKVAVNVSEEGTKAAAATAITISICGFSPPLSPPIEFNADHPFVYLIRDNSTGAILFMGQEGDPTQG